MSETELEVAPYPVVGWEVASSEPRDCMLVRFHYLTTADADIERPNVALLHSLSAAQARTLALDLLNELAKMDA